MPCPSALFYFMRIAVDVMGGDHGCGVVVEGARLALIENPRVSRLFLVGNQPAIEAALSSTHREDERVVIVHAPEVLTMEDRPVLGLRKKRNCSIARAVELVKLGQADALISPGNTGGVVAASTLKLRPLAGVDRPAIATLIPTSKGGFLLLDAGATIDCKPLHLAHFAIMGTLYSRTLLGTQNPRVGILNVGREDEKGNELTREALKLCRRLDLNFIGNIEGNDLFGGHADVVICDGFVGNITLKTCEAVIAGVFDWLGSELAKTPVRKLGALLARDAFSAVKRRLDPDAHGGAPLLGLKGTVIIAHGSAREKAIANAIRLATEALQHQINQTISEEALRANERLAIGNRSIPALAKV